MSYSLRITPLAEEDLLRLIGSLPAERSTEAAIAVRKSLDLLAANPRLGILTRLKRPTYFFDFEAGKVNYRWGAVFCWTLDERSIVITRFFRPAM